MKNIFYKKFILLFVSLRFLLLFNIAGAMAPERAKAILEKIYDPIGYKCYTIPEEEDEFIKKEKSDSLYGEMTLEAGRRLFDELKLTGQEEFWDLGSGAGKLCLDAFLTTAANIFGVELSKTRFNHSEEAKKSLFDTLKKNNNKKLNLADRKLEFYNANIIKLGKDQKLVGKQELDNNNKKAREAFNSGADKTVFIGILPDAEFIRAVTRICGQNLLVNRLVVLEILPKNSYFELDHTSHYPMSWSGDYEVPVYFYRRQKKIDQKSKQVFKQASKQISRQKLDNKNK